MIESNQTILIFISLFFGGVLGFLFIKRRPKKENEITVFFAKYTENLSEEETTLKIIEIANVNSQYPANDKKIAQALLKFYNNLNAN